jgi:hypothetical protein
MNKSKEQVKEITLAFEPTVMDSYKNGWNKMWKYFLELFLIGLIAFLIGIPNGLWYTVNEFPDVEGIGALFFGVVALYIWLFTMAYILLLQRPIEYGMAFAHLKAARDDKLEVKHMFDVFKNYWNAVLANILVGLIVIIGLIFFIVPGIFLACKLAFVPYIVVDRKLDVIEAIKESWNLTDGYAIDVFVIALLAIPITIGGLLLFFVGIIISIIWIRLAFASLYHAVSIAKGEIK